MNLISGLDGLGKGLKCPDQLHEKLSWDLNLKLAFPVENLSYLISALLAETLNEPGNPWPESE